MEEADEFITVVPPWKVESAAPSVEQENDGDVEEPNEEDDMITTEENCENTDDSDDEQYEQGYLVDHQDSCEPPSKKSFYQFETDPRTRKRHCKKLLARIRQIIDEFSARVGQQVALIVAQPPTPDVKTISTYGSTPLQEVVKRYHPTILNCLSESLALRAPPKKKDPSLFDLPSIAVEGVTIPLMKMTQAQLREFIPLMIRYSTGRGKPGWGMDRMRPPWWPTDLPWSNIRLDPRDADSKMKETWSDTLRRIIISCYKHHDREDLLIESAGGDVNYARVVNPSEEICLSSSPDETLYQETVTEPPVEPSSSVPVFLSKNDNDTRHVILTDADGREYCVQIAVPSNGQHTVIANIIEQSSEQTINVSSSPVVLNH